MIEHISNEMILVKWRNISLSPQARSYLGHYFAPTLHGSGSDCVTKRSVFRLSTAYPTTDIFLYPWSSIFHIGRLKFISQTIFFTLINNVKIYICYYINHNMCWVLSQNGQAPSSVNKAHVVLLYVHLFWLWGHSRSACCLPGKMVCLLLA